MMDKSKINIKTIKDFIITNNIHIWILLIVLFFISFYSKNKLFVKQQIVYPKSIVVTGDSYAGFLMSFEDLKDYSMVNYAVAGKTLSENFNRLKEAMHQDIDIVVISIGANEVLNDTDPEEFARLFRALLLEAYKYGKTIITHEFLGFNFDNSIYKNKAIVYDASIRKEICDFDNVYYIDMSDCERDEYLQNDKIHYNKVFYDVLYDRIKDVIDAKYDEDIKRIKDNKKVDYNMLFMSIFALLLTFLVLKLKKNDIIDKSSLDK